MDVYLSELPDIEDEQTAYDRLLEESFMEDNKKILEQQNIEIEKSQFGQDCGRGSWEQCAYSKYTDTGADIEKRNISSNTCSNPWCVSRHINVNQ